MMCHVTMFQVTVVLVLVALDFQEDKSALGQSLVILLELVCVFANALLIDRLVEVEKWKIQMPDVFFSFCRSRTWGYLTRSG